MNNPNKKNSHGRGGGRGASGGRGRGQGARPQHAPRPQGQGVRTPKPNEVLVVRSNLYRLRGDAKPLWRWHVEFRPALKTSEAREAAVERALSHTNALWSYDGDAILVSSQRDLRTMADAQVTLTEAQRVDPAHDPVALALMLRAQGVPRLGKHTHAPAGIERGDTLPKVPGAIVVPTVTQVGFLTATGTQCLCVDAGRAILLSPQPVVEYLRQCQVVPSNSRGMAEALCGVRVTLQALAGRRGTRTVRCISKQRCGDIRFQNEAGELLSLPQHFERTYGLRVDARNYALCTKQGDSPIFYPVEACAIASKQRAPQPAAVEASLRANCLKPDQRAKAKPLLSPMAKEAGMTVASEPIMTKAHVLTGPSLLFGGNKAITSPSWNMQDKRVYSSVKCIQWYLVVPRQARTAAPRVQLALESSFPEIFRKSGVPLEARCSGCFEHHTEVPQMKRRADVATVVFVLLPSPDAHFYHTVKRYFHERNMTSSCLLERNAFKKEPTIAPSYAANVALKVNGKLGHPNWLVQLPRCIVTANASLQVLGMDITHAPPGSSSPSTAAVVASCDSTMGVYAGHFHTLPPRTEQMGHDAFQRCVEPLLRRFAHSNGAPAQRVVFFRDGVALNQYEYVMREELAVLKRLVPPQTQVVFVVVTKRHHVRLCWEESNGTLANLPPSTVVYDPHVAPAALLYGQQRVESFYLHPHQGALGTSRTALCSVLHNDTTWSTRDLAQLCNALASGHATTTKAISLPSPVYHAHLLADKMRHVDSASNAALTQTILESDGQMWL